MYTIFYNKGACDSNVAFNQIFNQYLHARNFNRLVYVIRSFAIGLCKTRNPPVKIVSWKSARYFPKQWMKENCPDKSSDFWIEITNSQGEIYTFIVLINSNKKNETGNC